MVVCLDLIQRLEYVILGQLAGTKFGCINNSAKIGNPENVYPYGGFGDGGPRLC